MSKFDKNFVDLMVEKINKTHIIRTMNGLNKTYKEGKEEKTTEERFVNVK